MMNGIVDNETHILKVGYVYLCLISVFSFVLVAVLQKPFAINVTDMTV